MDHRSFPRLLNRSCGLAWLFLLMVAGAQASSAQTSGAGAQLSDSAAGRQVMVNYIVHFAYHVQWPIEVFTGTDAPFRICAMGADSLYTPLAERMKNQRVNGRRAEVEIVSAGDRLRVRRCQIVVLGAMERSALAETLVDLEFFPVLTVSDAERFAASGGMVEFAGSGDRMALQLNKTELERAELKMGTSLFRLSQELSR